MLIKKVEKDYMLLIDAKCINGINDKASRISSPFHHNIEDKLLSSNW